VFQESQVLLTLTNPVENITRVTLSACEDDDPDDLNSTAKVLEEEEEEEEEDEDEDDPLTVSDFVILDLCPE